MLARLDMATGEVPIIKQLSPSIVIDSDPLIIWSDNLRLKLKRWFPLSNFELIHVEKIHCATNAFVK